MLDFVNLISHETVYCELYNGKYGLVRTSRNTMYRLAGLSG